jgi:hypothetical protein
MASFDEGNVARGCLVLVLAEMEGDAGVELGLQAYRRVGLGHIYDAKWMETARLTDMVLN